MRCALVNYLTIEISSSKSNRNTILTNWRVYFLTAVF